MNEPAQSSPSPSQRPGRLRVGVIGAGRVGAVLASALRSSGHIIVAVSGSSEQTRDRVEALLGNVPITSVEDVLEHSELVLLTVPDDDLGPLVHGLAELGHFRAGQLVVHCAGRHGTEVLAPAQQAGAIGLAIHPAMTFTGTSIDLTRLVGAPFAVSAAAPVLPIAQALVVELGGEPIVLADDCRGRYHAALSHGANHIVTITAQAIQILTQAGIEDGGALLRPLLTTALDGALRGGDTALTGPISRGDAGTVAAHLQDLAGVHEGAADILPTYAALARATTQRALATGRINDHQAGAVLDAIQPGNSPPDQPSTPAQPAQPAGGDRTPRVVHTPGELGAVLTPAPAGQRAVVMTMGALHDGHLDLVREAKRRAEQVVVTIFVNPLQFGPEEDLAEYPRTLDADLAALSGLGVDVVFAPTAEDMYPHGEPEVHVRAGAMGQLWEGAARPGHFDGMLTVVNKLLHLTRPDVALFGHKDAQQLALVRRMVADLNMAVEIIAVPIVREADGLALSSRNKYLSAEQRQAALVLARAVAAAQAAADHGPAGALAAAEATLATRCDQVELDYVAAVDPLTMKPAALQYPSPDASALVIIAARVGSTRLIDNALIAGSQAWEEDGT